jgi:hypothetical protein
MGTPPVAPKAGDELQKTPRRTVARRSDLYSALLPKSRCIRQRLKVVLRGEAQDPAPPRCLAAACAALLFRNSGQRLFNVLTAACPRWFAALPAVHTPAHTVSSEEAVMCPIVFAWRSMLANRVDGDQRAARHLVYTSGGVRWRRSPSTRMPLTCRNPSSAADHAKAADQIPAVPDSVSATTTGP